MSFEVASLLVGDNYIHLLTSFDQTIVIDPGHAGPVIQHLRQRNWAPVAILLTHHHSDHTAGVKELRTVWPSCMVVSPHDSRLHHIDRRLNDGEEVEFAGVSLTAILVPGHTRSSMAFHEPDLGCLFTGDTLFAAGCGRMFEGTAQQMYASLQKLASYPETTSIYCGHEYTEENLRFALSVEPSNRFALDMLEEVRRSGKGVPSTIGREKQVNPFLRTQSPEIRTKIEMISHSDWEVFGELRKRKNSF